MRYVYLLSLLYDVLKRRQILVVLMFIIFQNLEKFVNPLKIQLKQLVFEKKQNGKRDVEEKP